MPATSHGGLRGVSELVSAALLVIIVVTVGTMVVARLIETASTGVQVASQESLRQLISARQALVVVGGLLDTAAGTVRVYIGSGDFPVTLQAVYVNDEPVSCTVSWDGEEAQLTGNNTVTMPAYTLALISCPTPTTQTPLRVTVYYEGGSTTALIS